MGCGRSPRYFPLSKLVSATDSREAGPVWIGEKRVFCDRLAIYVESGPKQHGYMQKSTGSEDWVIGISWEKDTRLTPTRYVSIRRRRGHVMCGSYLPYYNPANNPPKQLEFHLIDLIRITIYIQKANKAFDTVWLVIAACPAASQQAPMIDTYLRRIWSDCSHLVPKTHFLVSGAILILYNIISAGR